jgi:hypothetical protein
MDDHLRQGIHEDDADRAEAPGQREVGEVTARSTVDVGVSPAQRVEAVFSLGGDGGMHQRPSHGQAQQDDRHHDPGQQGEEHQDSPHDRPDLGDPIEETHQCAERGEQRDRHQGA